MISSVESVFVFRMKLLTDAEILKVFFNHRHNYPIPCNTEVPGYFFSASSAPFALL